MPKYRGMTTTVPIARAIVYNDGNVLVLQNADTDPNEDARGKWEMPGGIVENHDEQETVSRELKEETGLDAVIEKKLERIAVEDPETGEVSDCQYYLVHVDSREVTLSEEHQDYRWIKPGEFKDMNWLNYAGYTIPLLQKLGRRFE